MKKVNKGRCSTADSSGSTKTSHSSSIPVNQSNDLSEKPCKYLEEYRSLFDWRSHPLTERFLDKFCSELVTWARTDDNAIRVEDFPQRMGVFVQTYYSWFPKYPMVPEAHNEAMVHIANRRERKGLEKKYDATLVEKTMPLFDERYRKWYLEKAAKAQSNNQVTLEQMAAMAHAMGLFERVPDSPLVPPKKKDEV